MGRMLVTCMAFLLPVAMSADEVCAAEGRSYVVVPDVFSSIWGSQQRSLSITRPISPSTTAGANSGAQGGAATAWPVGWGSSLSRPVRPATVAPAAVAPATVSAPVSTPAVPAATLPARQISVPMFPRSVSRTTGPATIRPPQAITPAAPTPLQPIEPSVNPVAGQLPGQAPWLAPTPERRSTAQDERVARGAAAASMAGSNESGGAYGTTLQSAGQRRSVGNLLPDDPRTYRALYGSRPGSYVADPRRSMGNLMGLNPVPPGSVAPVPSTYARRAMGNRWPISTPVPGSGGSVSPPRGRRSTGNFGPINRFTPGAAAPSGVRQRRSMGNRRPAASVP